MIFVTILPAGAYVVGLLVLMMIAVSEGGAGNALIDNWVFSPSFILVAVTILFVLLFIGALLADWLSKWLRLKRVNDFLFDVEENLGNIAILLFGATLLFHFWIMMVCIFGYSYKWEWMWTRLW